MEPQKHGCGKMTYMNVMLGGQSGRRAPVCRFRMGKTPVWLDCLLGGKVEAEDLLEHGVPVVAAEKWLGPESSKSRKRDLGLTSAKIPMLPARP